MDQTRTARTATSVVRHESGNMPGKKVKELGISGEGRVRVNQAGCLDRCEEGPVCVVYPEGTWYTYVDEADVDEIIDSHLINGKPVDRLKI